MTVRDIQPAPKTATSGYVFLRKQNTPKLNGLKYQQHLPCSQLSTLGRAQRGEQRLGLGHLEATPFAWGEVHTGRQLGPQLGLGLLEHMALPWGCWLPHGLGTGFQRQAS